MLKAKYKKCDFKVNPTKIKGGFQLGSKVVPQDSKSDLPLARGKMFSVFRSHYYYRSHV